MHRALNHLQMGPGEVANSVMLVIFFLIVWLTALPWACRFWSLILRMGIAKLPLDASLGFSDLNKLTFLRFQLPYLKIQPVLPSSQMWGYSCILTLGLFAITFMLSSRWVPVVYLLRAILLIQASALLYFALIPARFPHTPDSYMEGLITSGAGLISAIPFLFGLTFYIFQISALKKISITIFTMTYLVVFLPFQMLLQALVLQKTVLFMPLLYVVFGMPLDVMLVIAIYSYGMTWA